MFRISVTISRFPFVIYKHLNIDSQNVLKTHSTAVAQALISSSVDLNFLSQPPFIMSMLVI